MSSVAGLCIGIYEDQLFIQHMIKFDLIQFCSSGVQFSGVLNIAWYLPLGYSHSSVTSNQINIFYGFGKMALS